MKYKPPSYIQGQRIGREAIENSLTFQYCGLMYDQMCIRDSSIRAASHAGRVLFMKDGVVYHQIYKGARTNEQMYQEISNTLTLLSQGGISS